MLQSELDNLTRWNGKENPFYEVYYLKLNDPRLRTALWLRYALTSPVGRAPYGSVWAIFFDGKRPQANFAERLDFSMSEVSFRRQKFKLNIGNCRLNNSSAVGEIKGAGNQVSWNLAWDPAVSSYHHYPWPMYFLPWPASKVVAPNLNVPVAGEFVVNGLRYNVGTILNQGHIWGRRMSERWAWANCGIFVEDRSAVLELIGNPRVGYGLLKIGDAPHRFRIRGSYTPLGWEFEGRTFSARIQGTISARREDIVGVAYDAPEGGHRYCYNTKLAEAHIKVGTSTLTSIGTTAFETVEARPLTNFKVVA